MIDAQDTSPEIQQIYRDLLFKKTPQERLTMGLEMQAMGMKMWFARIERQHPDYSPDQVRAKMLHEMLRTDATLEWVCSLPVYKTLYP